MKSKIPGTRGDTADDSTNQDDRIRLLQSLILRTCKNIKDPELILGVLQSLDRSLYPSIILREMLAIVCENDDGKSIGYIKIAESLIKKSTQILYSFDRLGLLPIHYVRTIQMLGQFIRLGANVNAGTMTSGKSLLHIICQMHEISDQLLQLVSYLLKYEGVSIVDKEGYSALHYSINPKVTKLLLQKISANTENTITHETPIHMVSRFEDRMKEYKLVMLLNNRANPNARDKNFLAAINSERWSIPSYRALLQHGAGINSKDESMGIALARVLLPLKDRIDGDGNLVLDDFADKVLEKSAFLIERGAKIEGLNLQGFQKWFLSKLGEKSQTIKAFLSEYDSFITGNEITYSIDLYPHNKELRISINNQENFRLDLNSLLVPYTWLFYPNVVSGTITTLMNSVTYLERARLEKQFMQKFLDGCLGFKLDQIIPNFPNVIFGTIFGLLDPQSRLQLCLINKAGVSFRDKFLCEFEEFIGIKCEGYYPVTQEVALMYPHQVKEEMWTTKVTNAITAVEGIGKQ